MKHIFVPYFLVVTWWVMLGELVSYVESVFAPY